jgi:alkylation response protein AidB-like acyl-CoA dehydrogenase
MQPVSVPSSWNADDAGLSIDERIDVIAPHPLATLGFKGCRIPEQRLIGEVGQGFRLAMRTLDVFRTSVAAAALGFGQRALDEALAHAQARTMFGKRLADFQLDPGRACGHGDRARCGTVC